MKEFMGGVLIGEVLELIIKGILFGIRQALHEIKQERKDKLMKDPASEKEKK